MEWKKKKNLYDWEKWEVQKYILPKYWQERLPYPTKGSGKKKDAIRFGEKPWTLEFCRRLCGYATYQLWHIRQNTSSLCLRFLNHKKEETYTQIGLL